VSGLFLDTNVLIASLWMPHAFHAASRRCFDLPGKHGTSVTCIAEAFRVLCVTPQIGMTPTEATTVLTELIDSLTVEPVPAEGVAEALARIRSQRLAVRSIFDHLIAASAHGHGYTTLVTWNRKDFQRLPFKLRVVTPDNVTAPR
jgi:predicted nucleic acid-binding protein